MRNAGKGREGKGAREKESEGAERFIKLDTWKPRRCEGDDAGRVETRSGNAPFAEEERKGEEEGSRGD
jgi:hypothetical protein